MCLEPRPLPTYLKLLLDFGDIVYLKCGKSSFLWFIIEILLLATNDILDWGIWYQAIYAFKERLFIYS